jgi:hypothetical protein
MTPKDDPDDRALRQPRFRTRLPARNYRGDARSHSNWSRPSLSPFHSSSRRPPCRSATGRCWSGPRPPRRRRRSSITRKGGSAFCGHSGSRANGPARSGRPDDKAPRGRPQSMTTGSDYGFRARGRAPAPRNDESRRADLAQQATAPPPLDRIGVNLTGGADQFTDCATDSCELRSYERGAFLAPGRRSGA